MNDSMICHHSIGVSHLGMVLLTGGGLLLAGCGDGGSAGQHADGMEVVHVGFIRSLSGEDV